MDAALAKATVPEAVTVYRGVTGEFAAGLQPGSEFTDPGYGSTSLSPDAGEMYGAGQTVMRIVVPKGTHAAYITAMEANKGHEQELLLPRGCKYKITGETTENGKRILTAEIVPPGKSTESRRREDAGQPPFPGAVFDKSKHRWVKPGDAKPAHVSGATAKPAENPPPAEHMTGGLAEKVAQADPEAAKDKGLLGKLGDAVVKAGARIYLFALGHHDTIVKGVAVLEAVFDTPQDLKEKLGYDPSTSAGTSHAAAHDSIKSATGISGHIVILAASHAMAKAVGWLKKQLGASEAAGDLDALAEVIAGMLAIAAEEFGLATPPDGPAVAAKLRELLKGA
jgi:hypothetical protein